MGDADGFVGSDELVLHVNGRSVAGWTDISVTRALDQGSGSFTIAMPAGTMPARLGDPVELRIGEDLVLTGYVRVETVQDAEDGATVELAGLDRTGDLVECSTEVTPAEWSNLHVDELVAKLVAPFSLELDVAPGLARGAPFAKFAARPGESVWSAIERAARLRGVLCYAQPTGQLVLAPAGAARSAVDLQQGVNVQEIRAQRTDADQFSTYRILGEAPVSAGGWGPGDPEIVGEAKDEGIRRYRPLVVLAEAPVTFEDARDRARWEAQVRAARADRMSVTTLGWRQKPGGQLWEINRLVGVRYPKLGIDAVRLVNALRFTRGAGGTFTELELLRPDAYAPEPVVEKRASDWEPSDDQLSGDDGGEDL